MSDWLYLTLALALVAANAFFVAAEFAMVSTGLATIETRIADGVRLARVVQYLKFRLDEALAACQLGITFASLGLGWVGEPAMGHLLAEPLQRLGYAESTTHTIGFLLAFGLISGVHIVVGEQAPKVFSIRFAARTAEIVALPLLAFIYLIYPFIRLLSITTTLVLRPFGFKPGVHSAHIHSTDELQLLIEQSADIGHLPQEEHRVIAGALEMGSITVQEIMVARPDVTYLTTDMSCEAVSKTIRTHWHARYPLFDLEERAVGVVATRDWIKGGEQGEDLAALIDQAPLLIPETLPVDEVMGTMQKASATMAIVIDEYGDWTGLVTWRDLFEYFTGVQADEEEEEGPSLTELGQGVWEAAGWVALRDVERALDWEVEALQANTVGGAIMERLGRIPLAGDVVEFAPYRFTVLRMDHLRVDRLRIERLPEES